MNTDHRSRILAVLAEAAIECGPAALALPTCPAPEDDPHAAAGWALDLACERVGVRVLDWDMRDGGELDQLMDTVCDALGWDFA